MRPEPVEGPEQRASTGSPRMGSTRLDELQLSAEPVDTAATRREPLDRSENGVSGSAALADEPESDRDHVR